MFKAAYWIFCSVFAPREWTAYVTADGECRMRRWNGSTMEQREPTRAEMDDILLDQAIR